MKYCYREKGANAWYVSENLKDVRDDCEVYIVESKLSHEGIRVIKHEEDVAEAEKEVFRAEEKMRAAQDRLRIEKLKTGKETA